MIQFLSYHAVFLTSVNVKVIHDQSEISWYNSFIIIYMFTIENNKSLTIYHRHHVNLIVFKFSYSCYAFMSLLSFIIHHTLIHHVFNLNDIYMMSHAHVI